MSALDLAILGLPFVAGLLVLATHVPLGMQVLVQILTGFGAKNLYRAASLPEARGYVSDPAFDLMIVDTLRKQSDQFIEACLEKPGDRAINVMATVKG